jgi:trans-AT polyketide synthase/acyltransferase/oxidoreductase domain-containing protein
MPSVGIWQRGAEAPRFRADEIAEAAQQPRQALHVVQEGRDGRIGVAFGGDVVRADQVGGVPAYPLMATLPPLYPEWLGDRSFTETHGLRYPYVAGAMANGICTTKIVIEMAKAGMMGFFGAAGLGPARIEAALDEIQGALGAQGLPYGSNLIHNPNEPDLEAAVVDLYVRRDVRRVDAAAYMGLTPMVVRYAYHGVKRLPDGRIERKNQLFAKISRPETARRFLAPPSGEMLEACLSRGWLTADEVALAKGLPVAEDVTVEADSGGHTDNRPLTALFPTIAQVRDELTRQYGYSRPIRVGAAGGIGTPVSVAAAYGLGAAYVLTGSVNQGAIESGLSDYGKDLLAKADLADVVMAPAADMFEMGVKVQVLKRGTLFGARAQKLYDVYVAYDGIPSIPPALKATLEKEIFQRPLEDVWAETRSFFAQRDPREVAKAERDPKHLMALVFRWYLGLSSKWAIAGDPGRKLDYQIWCGPAMGAFNAWTAGSFLATPANRTVVQIARNMLEGAAVLTRAHQLRTYGVPVPAQAFHYTPRLLA